MGESLENQACLVYITARDAAEARTIGRMLVERRLAACAVVAPRIDSCYWWEGRLVEDQEALLLAKTRPERVDELMAAVRAAHSYSVPAILVLPVSRGNPAYLDWLLAETSDGGR